MKAEYTAYRFGNLPHCWQTRLALTSSEPPSPLAGRQFGQLGRVRKFLGIRAQEVVAFAIENWVSFAARASAANGTEGWPSTPHVGFFVKYYDVAANMMLDRMSDPERVEWLAAVPAQTPEDGEAY